MNIEFELLDAMREHGIEPTSPLTFTRGPFIRFSILEESTSKQNGWLIINDYYSTNGKVITHARFGSWKTGGKYKWCSCDTKHLSPKDVARLRDEMQKTRKQAEQERLIMQEHRAKDASTLWSRAQPTDAAHPYCVQKGVFSFCARQYGNDLVLPITDTSGKVWSCQFIKPTGDKRFFSGGALRGNFILIHGDLNTTNCVYICEGFSTGATLATVNPDVTVIAALNANNLTPVAQAIRILKPNVTITICADDDRKTVGNPGLTQANKAALTVGASISRPQWPADAPLHLSDFNDLYCWLEQNKKEGALL